MTFSCPDEPPKWLAFWPSPDACETMFSPAIQRTASRIISNINSFSIEWGDKVLRGRIGNHLVIWRLTEQNTWIRNCSCGAPPNQCPHGYMAAFALNQTIAKRGWQGQTNETPARPAQSHETLAHTSAPNRANTPLQRSPKSDYNLFTDSEQREPQKHTLTVEVDFNHEPGMVTIRFYSVESGFRQLLTLSALYNIIVKAERLDLTNQWPELDLEFFNFLKPTIQKIPWQQRNFNVLKLSRETFRFWQERWENHPTRFIERLSQDYLKINNLTVPASLSVTLISKGDLVKIEASFALSGGKKLLVNEYFSELESNAEKNALIAKLKTFQSPVSMKTLVEYFYKSPPLVKRANLCRFLGTCLDGRYDVLTGAIVKRTQASSNAVTLYCETFAAQFVLKLYSGTTHLAINRDDGIAMSIRDDGTYIYVMTPDIGLIQHIRADIRAIPGIQFLDDGNAVLLQNAHNAHVLKALWDKPIQGIQYSFADNLKGLFAPVENPAFLMPVLNTRLDGPLAHISVSWNCSSDNQSGSTGISAGSLKRIIQTGESLFRTSSGDWFSISKESAQKALSDINETDWSYDSETTVLAEHLRDNITQKSHNLPIELAESTKSYFDTLASNPPEKIPEIDDSFLAILRPYQLAGVNFLLDRALCHAGAILADDMGLGKTLQAIAAIHTYKKTCKGKFQVLVVAPASVMTVWKQQLAHFCPMLKCEVMSGTASVRKRKWESSEADVLISHYQLIRVDAELLADRSFSMLILDEAQAIKNPEAQVTQAISNINATISIAMTGTPLENSILDLWSIMNVLNPQFLGDVKTFYEQYHSYDGISKLAKRIAPLILRRKKDVVAKELPEKTEQVIYLEMPDDQRQIYDQYLIEARNNLKLCNRMRTLADLTRLRQICCHPELFDKTGSSIKVTRLLEQLSTLHASGHSTLVFSQFTHLLDIIAREMTKNNLPFQMITGETPIASRTAIVDSFQNTETPQTLLLSLRAAGTGLTLTKADYVFLMDPWWNPAVEQQAIDRTHRIGQTNPVVAYRFITQGTIEEKVLELLNNKRELFRQVVDNATTDEAPARLTVDDLRSLIM